jgi:hypothetical protein
MHKNADPVRQLCADIAAEKDSQKLQDLICLLQAVILAKRYATANAVPRERSYTTILQK